MYTIQKYIRKADLFGQQIQLNLKNKTQYQTVFGGLSSITSILIVILFCQRQAIMVYNKDQFMLKLSDEIYKQKDEEIVLENKDFVLAIKIMDSEQDIYKKFFDLQIEQRHYIKSNDTNLYQRKEQKIKLLPCTVDHFNNLKGGSLAKEFEQIEISSFYCLPLDQSIYLQGYYQSDIFSFLKISIIPCQDSTNCEPQSVIDDYLQQNGYFKFSLITSSYQVNPTEQQAVKLYLFDETYFTFNPYKYFPRSDLFIKTVQMIEDKSVIPFYNDIMETNFILLQQEDVRTQQIIGQKNDIFGEFFLRLSPQTSSIQKSYTKIDEFLAYVGGIIKILLSIIGVFVVTYNKYDMLITLANRLYNFNIPDDVKKDSMTQIYKDIYSMFDFPETEYLDLQLSFSSLQRKYFKDKLDKVNTNNSNNNHDENCDQKKIKKRKFGKIFPNNFQGLEDMLNKDYKIQLQKKHLEQRSQTISQLKNKDSFMDYFVHQLAKGQKKIKLKFQYILTRLFCRKLFYSNIEVQMIDTAIKAVKTDLNVQSLIERIQSIDNLKLIMLNFWQISLFNQIPKPLIHPKNIKKIKLQKKKEKQKLQDDDKFLLFQRTKDLFEAYNNLLEKNEHEKHKKQKKNKKIFHMIHPYLREIFNVATLLPEKQNKKPLQKLVFTFPEEQEIEENQKNLMSVSDIPLDSPAPQIYNRNIKATRFQSTPSRLPLDA